MLKKYFWGVFIVIFFLITLASMPRVDYVEPNVFFYLGNLPLIYHICVLASVFIAILVRQKLTQILAICVFALLIIWTPFIMLVQPWHLDSYPFLADAVYVIKEGTIFDPTRGYITQTPALCLTFGSYILITGINPFALLKIYPAFLAIILVVLIYLTTNNLRIGGPARIEREASTVASLLLVSIFWPNNLHFSRQSISLVAYFMSLFLIFRLIFHKSDRRVFGLLCLQIIFMCISHPATPLFFISNLFTIVAFGLVTHNIRSEKMRVIISSLMISVIFWLLWNSVGAEPGIIPALKQLGDRVVESIQQNPSEVPGFERIFAQYTPNYQLIIDIRFRLTFLVYVASFLIPLFMLAMQRHLRTRTLILAGVAWSNMAFTVPLLYGGLPYFSKPFLFTIVSWAPIGGFAYATLTNRKKIVPPKTSKIIGCTFLVAFVIVPSLLMPIVKYAPLPYLYPTSVELANKSFLDLHWRGTSHLYLEIYYPIHYSYILYGAPESVRARHIIKFESVYHLGEGIDLSAINSSSVWTTYRLCSRDAFYAYKPSLISVVENVTLTLPERTHNKVYDAGWPEWILIALKQRRN